MPDPIPDSVSNPTPGSNDGAKSGSLAARLLLIVSTLAITLGMMLVLSVSGLYAYGAYERSRFEAEIAQTPLAVLLDEAPPTLTPTPTYTSAPVVSEPTVVMAPAALATPTAFPLTPTPRVLAPPRRVLAPKAQIDARVVPSLIRDNQWVVPKFAAGHLEGTAYPGQPGNMVFSGHFESITSGNVFSSLDRLNPGDNVVVVTDAEVFEYVVFEKKIVPREDLSVIAPPDQAATGSGAERLTLITCTGDWLPLIKDFEKRLIVFASRK